MNSCTKVKLKHTSRSFFILIFYKMFLHTFFKKMQIFDLNFIKQNNKSKFVFISYIKYYQTIPNISMTATFKIENFSFV